MNAGMVKIAPATNASPTDAAVRVMFCSRMPPRNHGMRNRAIAMTAAGMVAATVWPAFIPRYALADPKTKARKMPSETALTVISGGGCFTGIDTPECYRRRESECVKYLGVERVRNAELALG